MVFLSELELDRWLGATGSQTGAPGRPSSMDVVLSEFERRRKNDQCSKQSRKDEAKDLVSWLKATHPAAPSLSYKTVMNKLPANFQPRGNRLTK